MPNSVARTSLFTIITVIEKNKNIKNKIKYSVARIFAHTSLQNPVVPCGIGFRIALSH